jgi:large subunit ribosomal protein L21
MFAVVDIAGFQEKVSEGTVLKVPLLSKKAGDAVVFEKVLLLGKSDQDIAVGAPYVGGIAVHATVLSEGKHPKVRVAKFARRKRFRRVKGHRQDYTEIKVTKIG